MKREPPYPNDKNFYLCGHHFRDEDFERDLMADLMPDVKRKFRIKNDAVPSIFTFSVESEKRRSNILGESKLRREILGSIVEEEDQPNQHTSETIPFGTWS